MTLLFMDGVHYGTSDISYKWDSTIERSVSAVTRRTGPKSLYCSVWYHNNGKMQKNLYANKTTLICGIAMKNSGKMATYGDIISFYNAGSQRFAIRLNDDGTIRGYVNGSLVATSEPTLWEFDTWFYVELKGVAHGTAGSLVCRINNVEVISYTGQNTGTATMDNIRLHGTSRNAAWNDVVTHTQDIYMLDGEGSTNNDFLGDIKVDVIRPSGAGTYTDFTPSAGSNWENVDESDSDGDTTYNDSTIIGDKDTYALSNISASGQPIYGTQQCSVIRKTDASIRYGKQILKSGATEDLSDEKQFNDSFTGYQRIFEKDPNTDTAWTESGVNALESGLEITA